MNPGQQDHARIPRSLVTWLGWGGLPSEGIRRYAMWWVLIVLTLAGLSAALSWQLHRQSGLRQTLFQVEGNSRTPLIEHLARIFDLSVLAKVPPAGFAVVRWSGVWYVPHTGFYDLSLRTDGRVVWNIDDLVAHENSSAHPERDPRTVLLLRGFHPIEVEYERRGRTPSLQVAWAPTGRALRPLNPYHLSPSKPEYSRLWAALESGRRISQLLLVSGLAIGVWVGLLVVLDKERSLFAGRRLPFRVSSASAVLAAVLPALVIGYAAVLRFDAITHKYGTVESPRWLHALQVRSHGPLGALRPASLSWEPVTTSPHRDGPPTYYTSDPYTYLQYARQMRSFYAAHYREPLFPFITRLFLRLLDNQDVAVSFASASFSVLAVLATYLLGRLAFSQWAGLGAALAMAIEYDVVSWSVGGWKDDAFTFAVTMSAYTMLKYFHAPSRRHAILMGIFAAVACLVRITSLSFLLPGFIYLLLASSRPWRERLGGIGLGVLTMTVIVAPYLFNCWRVFGNPLYAIDAHTNVYLATEGQAVASPPTATAYVASRALSRPFQTLDTVALGITSYPFLNKWGGFDRWIPALGKWLSWASLLGMLLLLGSGAGRLLLLVLLTSLVPFAVTWKLLWDWRFTEHAYPFFLIASFVAVTQPVTWMARMRELPVAHARVRQTAVFWILVLGGIAGVGWMVVRALPILTARESLHAGEPATIAAGVRDGTFFGEGWSAPLTDGNITARVSQGVSSVMWVPLPAVGDYDLTVRLDPFPRPLRGGTQSLPVVRVFVNGRALQNIALAWNPERVGAYDIALPREFVKTGWNRLMFAVNPRSARQSADGRPGPAGLAGGTAFRLWYLRVRPSVSATP
jgi:4-amino-4-deoxy-L-arabinose transferase-like glycosyltransferase